MNKTSLGNTNVTAGDVADVVRRIVEAAQPEKIILFGSAARGEMDSHSDLDILVVKSGADHWSLSSKIRRALRGVNVGVDLVVATPENIERYKDSHPLVYKPALREGRVLYDAA
jgi:predicted nucleotidyltransferase